jgi:hypothetical protein
VRKDVPPLRRILVRVAAPATVVMALAFAALGYYFWRVTGSPFTVPYKPNMQTYGLVYFPWDKIGPVQFHHAIMKMFYRGDPVIGVYNFARQHPLQLQFFKALVVWLFYFGPVLTMPFAVWLLTRPRGVFWKSFTPQIRFILILCAVTYVSIMLTIYIGQPHYAAPLTATFYILILLVMRDLWHWQSQGKPSGRFLVRSVPVICVILFLTRAAAPALHVTPKPSWVRTWCSEDWQNLERARILKQLEKTPGEHLVIVRYHPGHDFILDEWVFNNADIDGSRVVWARDMGDAANEELLRYFSGRHVWLVEPDAKSVKPLLYGFREDDASRLPAILTSK